MIEATELPDPVVLAYVHDVEIPHSFFDSHRRLVAYDLSNNQRMIRAGEMGVRYGTGGIVGARNKTIVEFLKTNVPWLCWIDTDMGYPANVLDLLVESADPVERPIMGGLCFASREIEPDGLGGFHTFPVPTVYDWVVNADGTRGFLPRRNYETNAVIEVAGTGSACILIHRTVFERILELEGCTCPGATLLPDFVCPGHWYDPFTIIETGAQLSEDLAFCTRATRAGFPVHINTAVKTTHFKPVWLGELHYQLYRKALGEDSLIELQAVGYKAAVDAVRVDTDVAGELDVTVAPLNRAARRAKRRQQVKS